MTTPKTLGYRMPAEYEPHQGTLMAWPTRPGSWPYDGKGAKEAFARIIATIRQTDHAAYAELLKTVNTLRGRYKG